MAVALLGIIILIVTRVFNSAIAISSSGSKRLDADMHARALLNRMSIDFAKMVRRSDLDVFLKEPSVPQSGNDQIAFFCALPGYYPSAGAPSPLSLVSYRINPDHQMERMGKGLDWNGASQVNSPLVFLPVKISQLWLAAITQDADDDYELAGLQAFRFEYYYLLQSGVSSITPWDSAAGHTSVAGLQDVTAVCVLIATIDPKSRVLLSDTQLDTLSDTMSDATDGQAPGALAKQWQDVLDGVINMPRPAISSVRIYERYLYVVDK